MQVNPVSLFELNNQVKNIINTNLGSYWLTAELSEVKTNYSGHCYVEFIQKDEKNDKILARARGTIWATKFRMLKPYFETTTGRIFSEGIKVMVKVKIEYHEIYGLSLNVIDIEPTYTVGELALRKQKILQKLTDEGVLEMNKELDLSMLPTRLAIISSKTAAGLKDFLNQLYNNSSGFKFRHKLFHAIMQGAEAESSIINQLDAIFQNPESFDAVVIIRGGGAQADLECFNSYWLAYNITQFPIPVLTGIGHEQDETVVDIVAHTKLKTPTAVAEFLIDMMAEIESLLLSIENSIVTQIQDIIRSKKSDLQSIAYIFKDKINTALRYETKALSTITSSYYSVVKNSVFCLKKQLDKSKNKINQHSNNFIINHKTEIDHTKLKLNRELKLFLSDLNHQLEIKEQNIRLNNPKTILKKGYSITLFNKKPIKDSTLIKKGDEIETLYYKGKTKSIIK